jgi:hypothetical protein
MSSFSWLLGKTLQLMGLLTTGFALYVGLSTGDSKRELMLLLAGAAQFLIGGFCLSRGASSS